MSAKIKLNAASGGGSFSLQAPSSSSNDRVMTLPDTADGTILTTTNPKAGNIIQVVQTDYDQHVATTVASQGSANTKSFFSATITPTLSSSKILVTYSFSLGAPSDIEFAYTILRTLDGSDTRLAEGSGAGNRRTCTGVGEIRVSSRLNTFNTQFLDSPNTTNACQYSLEFMHDSSASRDITINYDSGNADSYGAFRTSSIIIAREVAG